MAHRNHAKHREIARRYQRRRQPVSISALRVRDLSRLFDARYGDHLPDDDAGREDLAVMIHHLVGIISGNPVDRIRQWVRTRAPWCSIADLDRLTNDAMLNPRRWKADRLAWRMRLTDADRSTLKITTIGAIDVGKGSRAARRRAQARERKERTRRAQGIKPRHEYEAKAASRLRPWEALGISRAQWYRTGKPVAP